jgi:hypothetical protein
VISSWSVDPGSAIWVVMLIFFAGLALSLVGWGVDPGRAPTLGPGTFADPPA